MIQAMPSQLSHIIQEYLWIMIPLIGGIIGWVTNLLAVKMLFRPRRAIYIFGINIQGVFPKRQHLLAEKIAHLVSTELLSAQDLRNKLEVALSHVDLRQVIVSEIDNIITNKLPMAVPMLGMFLNNELAEMIKNLIAKELEGSLVNTINGISIELEKSLDIKDLVYSKVANFSSERLEELVLSVMKREFKFIEVIGGVLGFIIGIFQVLLMNYAN